jgi:hypothetical protein
MQTWAPGHPAHDGPQRVLLVSEAQVLSSEQKWKPASQV